MSTKSSTKKSARKVEVTWKYATPPAKVKTAFSGRGPVANAVANGVKAQPAKGKFALGRRSDPDIERLATATAVRKVLKPKQAKKGKEVMNKKAGRKVASVLGRKAARGERGKVGKRVARSYDEPSFKKLERQTAAERLVARKERKAAAARMTKSLENYPKNPKIGERVWEYDDSKKGKGKKSGKGRKNQAGAAHERKSAAKAARIAAREERKMLKEQARAERIAARERKAAEREEKKRLKNVPGILFTPAMLKDVMAEFVNTTELKINERRLARLAKQAERLSTSPLKKIQTRIRNMRGKIALMEAIVTVGKAALDDGYNKFVEPKVRGGKKGGKRGFGRKAEDSEEAPAPAKQARRSRKAAKVEPVSKANGSIATVAKVRGGKGGKKDRKAAIGAALALAASGYSRRK